MRIYGLFDPSGELRYVGKTTRSLEHRLRGHLHPYALRPKAHRANWLKGLLARGERPTIQLIQELFRVQDLREAEVYWIAFFRGQGCRLVNGTNGGEGPDFQSEKTKRQIAATLKKQLPRSDEYRRKLSAALMGHEVSAETRLKISAARKGIRPSDETKRKMSLAHKGRPLSAEHVAKVAAAHRGMKRSVETRERIAAAARRRAR